MSDRRDHRAPPPPPPVDDEPSDGDLDSEPRRKWTPNAALIQALAATQKDLRPGEASLFWDWTATRDSAPPAEDVRPSGEGEVLVCDKDAAAAYVPPKQVAPAATPRPATRSRIRVREDVDPRRQPTVKTSRSSDPATIGAHLDAHGSAPPSERAPAGSERPSYPYADERESITPFPGSGGTLAPRWTCRPLSRERRDRLVWAVLVSTLTGTIVFLWLHLPPDLDARLRGKSLQPPAGPPDPPAAAPASDPSALPSSPPHANAKANAPDAAAPRAPDTPVAKNTFSAPKPQSPYSASRGLRPAPSAAPAPPRPEETRIGPIIRRKQEDL